MQFIKSFCFFIIFTSTCACAENTSSIKIGDYSVMLDKQQNGYINVDNNVLGIKSICEIKNWKKNMGRDGGGVLSLTSDQIALLVYSGDQYLRVKDVLSCNNQPIELQNISYIDNDIATIIDINFAKKIVLALVVIDAQSLTYQAIVTNFGGHKNILSGKGFWDSSVKNVDDDDDFSFGTGFFVGKISPDGKYVAPNDLDCSLDSFPGVWDVAKRMKVVLPSDKDDSTVDSKCQELFSGIKTLNELDGKLITAK